MFRSATLLLVIGLISASLFFAASIVGASETEVNPEVHVGARASDEQAARDHAIVEALLRLPPGTLEKHPEQRPSVLRFLTRKSGTQQYLQVAKQLGVLEQTDELVTLLNSTSSNLAIEAAKVLTEAEQFVAIEKAVNAEDLQAIPVVGALGFISDDRVQSLLQTLMIDPKRSLQIHSAAAQALGRQVRGQRILLALAKSGEVNEDIRFAVTNALLGSKNEDIAGEAAKYLQPPASAASEAIPPVQQLVRMPGSAAAGKVVYNTVGTCNKCHRVAGEGKEVGPDLSEIGSKLSREDMFVSILNPSAAVSHNFETYSLLDVNGRVITGLLINQNEQSVTLRTSEGIDQTVAAEDVEELKKQSISLMPADLQRAMSLQNLIDVVDYMTLLRRADESKFQAIESEGEDLRNPDNAVEGFEIAEGLEVQLFAAEPQLRNPTSIDVDHLGRVWVCEAVNYRHFRNTDSEPRTEGDRILILEDTDGDGKADRETVFYQGTDIDSPHGVAVLGERVYVSAGENVWLFTDSDGDLKPETKRPLFTGISGTQHDHGIHAVNIGPDGKLYFNFGNEGKQLRSASGDTIVDKAGNVVNDSRNPYQQGMVFRCNLDGTELETLGWNFRNNWEVCVDSFGNMWQSDNDDDGNRGTRINFVMEFGNYGYRDERTGDTWQVSRTGLEAEKPLQHWHLNDPGVVPNILQTGAGSPTGICFYEGDLLPAAFQNRIIHTDPGPAVVRAYPVEHDGAGYLASIQNMVQGVKDPWFRPVDVCAAPDGSLLVADWYDPGVGGHRMGDPQHGRIFRIIPKGHKGYAIPAADFSTPENAAQALFSPNLSTRFLAQQSILGFGSSAESALENLVHNSALPESMRARVYWQLVRVAKDAQAVINAVLKDESSDLRITGIRMARQHGSDLLQIVEPLKKDPSPQVRRELAIALRHIGDPSAVDLWVDLALQHDGHDRWYLEALGIAADKQWDRFFDAWLARVGDDWNTPAGRDIVWRCRSPKACRYLAEIISTTNDETEQYRYFRAFDFHEGEPKLDALATLVMKK